MYSSPLSLVPEVWMENFRELDLETQVIGPEGFELRSPEEKQKPDFE